MLRDKYLRRKCGTVLYVLYSACTILLLLERSTCDLLHIYGTGTGSLCIPDLWIGSDANPDPHSDPNFHFDQDNADPHADPTTSFTHVRKTDFLNTLNHIIFSLQCFIFRFSVKGVMFFSILDSILTFSGTSVPIFYRCLHLLGINTDPEPSDPDQHALDVDPDPDPNPTK
jgi:hypothetical protein